MLVFASTLRQIRKIILQAQHHVSTTIPYNTTYFIPAWY